MSCDTRTPVLDLECPCGHMRRDHADTHGKCDCGECPKYRGELRPYWNTNFRPTLYGSTGYVPSDDDVLMGDML